MDRQRSFSLKPTRLLVFSFTISSSIIFITLFTIWVTKATPSVPQQTHFQFNASSLSLGLQTVTVQTLTGLRGNSSLSPLKSSILIDARLRKQENISGVSEISVISGLQRENSESDVLEDEGNEGEGFIGNFTSAGDEKVEVSISEKIAEEKNSSFIDTQLKKQENISGVPDISVSSGLQRENGESQVVEDEENEGDGFTGNFTSVGDEKVEVPTSEKIEETVMGKASVSSIEKAEKKRTRKCDVTRGRWVYDQSSPLYRNGSCPYIDEGFDCVGNGRPDKAYMKLRWQPQDCDIPRFNATRMLELLRGKRLVFVGDSINRNQWESMLCMLMGGIRDPKKVYETHGRRITKGKGNYSFRFVDYKCTVEYYVTHFLVHEGKARVGQKRVQTLRIDSIDRGSSRWKGADILVFNTAHWWSHYKNKAGINYYQEAGQVHPRLDVSIAFRKALMTWASWVDKHINPSKTQVFFRTSSPSHFRGGQWNSGGHCKEATLPLPEISSTVVSEKNAIVEEVIKQMRTPVAILNITALSGYRIDGHPSTYGKRPGKQYSSIIQDCSHWCLPGVPDSWNELLYAFLQSKPGLAGFRLLDQ